MSTIERLTEQLLLAKTMKYVLDIRMTTSDCMFGYVIHVVFDSRKVDTPRLNSIIEHISTCYEPVCGVVLVDSVAEDTKQLKIVVKERPIGYSLVCI